MEVLQARIDSFKKSRRVKNPNKPSSTVTVKWPHPPDFKANPETLADAGFFYNPSYDGPDSVTCYVCDKELEGWEDDDDPHAIHWKKCGQKCCWASVRCGLLNDMDQSNRFVFTDKTRLPTHKVMEKARFDTFGVGKGWIHDQVKNHGANSKMMARAGFVYTPQQRNDDLVTCLYCDTSLSGWDADDDPMAEHRKRKKSCPFFSVFEPAVPANRAKSSKSKAPTRSTSKSKHQDILLPTKTHDGDPDNDSDSSQPVTIAKAATKTPRKGRSTSKSSAKTPKSKRSISRSKAEDSEDIPMKKPSRSKANASEDHKIPTKHFRTRSKAKIIESEPEEPPSSPAPARPKMKVVEVSSDEEEEPETTSIPTVFPTRKIDVEPEMAPPSQRVSKKVTTSLPKMAPSAAEPETVNEITSIPPVSPIQEIDTEPEMVHPAPTPPKKVMIPPLKVLSAVVELETVSETASVPTVSPIRMEPKPEMVYPAPSTPQRPLPQIPRTVITPPPKTVASAAVKPDTAAVPTVSPIREIDVVMGDIEPEPEMVYPSTPRRALPLTPPKVINPPLKTVQSAAVEVIPALSKLPITPFHTLTEAELDMTVEEWVRYQMDVEYDKFRRDGERELQRFRNQAEEVRKAIEGL